MMRTNQGFNIPSLLQKEGERPQTFREEVGA